MREPRSPHFPDRLPSGSSDRLAELREEFDLTMSKLEATASQKQRRELSDWLRAIVEEATSHLAKSEHEVRRMQSQFRLLGEPSGRKRLIKSTSQNHNGGVAYRTGAA
jgi:hypothetical protein